MAQDDLRNHCVELLAPLGHVRWRRMFGGIGIYVDDLFIAIIASDRSLDAWLDAALLAVPQATDGVVLTRPLRRADGALDPARPALELERLVRAYHPWPGTYAEFEGERLVVTAARVEGAAGSDLAGDLVRQGDEPALATADGRLVLERVTPPGKRPMSGADWLRGRRAHPG